MLPISYSVRNLGRAWPRTLQVFSGSLLTVFIILAAYAFNVAMKETLSGSGSPKNVMLVGTGSEESVERSQISPAVTDIAAASIRGLTEEGGKASVSPQIYYMGPLFNEAGRRADALFRGVTPAALAVHDQVAIFNGHFPGPGEILVGRLAAEQMGWESQALEPGAKLTVDGETFTISGVFEAPGTVFEAEIWLNLTDLMSLSGREAISTVVLKLDQAEFADVDLFVKQRLDLELSAVSEATYYDRIQAFYQPVQWMIWLSALLVTSGAVFGGLNTLYAGFISRKKELATLQAVGFGRLSLLWSMFLEALVLNLLAAFSAVLLGAVLLNGVEIAFANGVFALQIDKTALWLGLGTGGLLALVGVVTPAWHALVPPLTSTLRS